MAARIARFPFLLQYLGHFSKDCFQSSYMLFCLEHLGWLRRWVLSDFPFPTWPTKWPSELHVSPSHFLQYQRYISVTMSHFTYILCGALCRIPTALVCLAFNASGVLVYYIACIAFTSLLWKTWFEQTWIYTSPWSLCFFLNSAVFLVCHFSFGRLTGRFFCSGHVYHLYLFFISIHTLVPENSNM